jgi:hypothetical protein
MSLYWLDNLALIVQILTCGAAVLRGWGWWPAALVGGLLAADWLAGDRLPRASFLIADWIAAALLVAMAIRHRPRSRHADTGSGRRHDQEVVNRLWIQGGQYQHTLSDKRGQQLRWLNPAVGTYHLCSDDALLASLHLRDGRPATCTTVQGTWLWTTERGNRWNERHLSLRRTQASPPLATLHFQVPAKESLSIELDDGRRFLADLFGCHSESGTCLVEYVFPDLSIQVQAVAWQEPALMLLVLLSVYFPIYTRDYSGTPKDHLAKQ